MKYSEFKQKMKNVGLTIKEDELSLKIYLEGFFIATISKENRFQIEVGNYISDYQKNVFQTIIELAKTPLDERGEMKKYNVVAYETYEGFKGSGKCTRFYRRNGNNILGAMTEARNSSENQQWTMQQIKDWGLEDCERIEVKN